MIVIILINAVTLHNHSVHTPQLPKNNNVLCLRIVLEWFVGRGVGPEYKEPGRGITGKCHPSSSSTRIRKQKQQLLPPGYRPTLPLNPRSIISFLLLMPRVQSRAHSGTKKNMNGEWKILLFLGKLGPDTSTSLILPSPSEYSLHPLAKLTKTKQKILQTTATIIICCCCEYCRDLAWILVARRFKGMRRRESVHCQDYYRILSTRIIIFITFQQVHQSSSHSSVQSTTTTSHPLFVRVPCWFSLAPALPCSVFSLAAKEWYDRFISWTGGRWWWFWWRSQSEWMIRNTYIIIVYLLSLWQFTYTTLHSRPISFDNFSSCISLNWIYADKCFLLVCMSKSTFHSRTNKQVKLFLRFALISYRVTVSEWLSPLETTRMPRKSRSRTEPEWHAELMNK